MSLRLRLLLAVGAVALTALVIADVVTYQELRSFLYNRIDQSMEQSHIAIEGALGSGAHGRPGRGGLPSSDGSVPGHNDGIPPGFPVSLPTTTSPASSTGTSATKASSQPPTCNGFAGLSDDLFHELEPGTFIEVRSASNAILCRTLQPAPLGSSASADPTLPARITGFVSDPADFDEPAVYFTSADSQFRLRASVLSGGPYSGGQLVIGLPVGSTISTLDRLVAVELAVSGAALVAALLLGWWLVRVSFRPLRAVEATAEAIARGELAERVPGEEARTEVGRLARAINVMLGRIEKAFAQRDATEQDLRDSEIRMRQFVADASHELRTPLTAVSAYAELFEQGAATRADDLQRVMHGIRRETARMGSLVEDLLLLARLDEGRPLEHEEVELLGVAAEAVQTASTVGPQWPVRLVAAQPVEIVGDRMRLRQVLDNLLANVRTHCPAGTRCVVTVDTEDHDAVISVADDGPGLSPEQATRVFERFFRADPSRSRRMGGAGLGLSIVASITHAHGGSVSAGSGSDGGTVFTIRLPLSGVPEQRGSDLGTAADPDAPRGFTAGS